MKLATFFVATTTTVKATWDDYNCVEVPRCGEFESEWDNQCFVSNSHGFFQDGIHTYHTNVQYPLFALTDKFNTNSAVWIVMNDGAEFDAWETSLDNACGENQMTHCWTMIRRGQFEYKFDRGQDWSQTNLEMVNISFRNKYGVDPVEAVAERMVICDADLHGFPIKPTPAPEPEPLVCCDQMYQGNYPNWIHWQKTELTNAKNPVYQNGDGDFMWWMWHGDVGHWVINKTPGAHGNDLNKSELGPQKCPNEISSSDWDVNTQTTCLQCDKRLRPCEAWDDPATTDCYTWDVNYVGVSEWSEGGINYDHKYRASLKYPFLEQTSYHNAQKSVWINYVQGGPSRNQVTPDPECAGEFGECWMRNQNGARFLQFTRGSNPNRPDYKLDTADIDMDIQMGAVQLGHDIPLDAVYLCNANQHSPPVHAWDNVEPHAHLLPLPPASEPSVCSIDKLNEVTMNKDDLIAAGEKPGKAQRIVNFWNTQIINKFKTLYNKSQYSSCRYAGDFFCHELAPASSDYRDMYDWAQALFNERLGACGGYRQLDRKLQRWGNFVKLDAPVLEGTDCPRRCHHSSFHKYILPRIDYATQNGGFTKNSHKNKFKFTYTKWMTIMQNEYRESEQCQESVVNDDFDCLTVCLAKSPSELMSFYFARLGDSVLGREGCANDNTPPNRQPAIMKQMNGLNNWLSILNLSNADERSADFWLPAWAADL